MDEGAIRKDPNKYLRDESIPAYLRGGKGNTNSTLIEDPNGELQDQLTFPTETLVHPEEKVRKPHL